ncbi:ecdysone 20-monooxygenase isoform X2 [Fopius arisanus]|nr:PREDICTED: ecdysone 20-monooxygenase isoform X2 [Fopius arisanus]XP_011314520.1 PREDICTED: ecdysone 20-monooxygenase isoform X2 [Fopius arisanus]XP_011314522.1 PREDICTED: ecdysone 20-monooxygenase isoform X2 [Fopius arisanus]XP_011314523.1 PREDICTED: ecdysone 20-monooxygenase isoform X2 [Fopius arisanus]XP_011314524.1 PREDICTED: ecdysone 20-monooxygenase isoform X2 [Fopius arisanus]XP_011314525.1 PREDICTED: ecdysone 20-monooxygenase isoform X2 [Fopius arisanus]XP_011314526.1 PREDICTED: ecd
MLLSGAWFELICVSICAIVALATSYRPPWWFWSGTSHQSETKKEDKMKNKVLSVQDVPGPLSLPILGTRWIFSLFGSYRLDKVHDAYKDMNLHYGPLCKEEALWNYPVISLFSREDIETVIKRGSRFPLRPPQEIISRYRKSRRDRYTNLGLVNEQGETWHRLRSALTPELMGANTVSGFFPALNKVADEFINLIRNTRADDKVAGFEELAYRVGLESTCTLILGRHLGFLKSTSNNTTARLAEAVRVHFKASRDAFYGLPLWKVVPTTAYKELIQSEDEIYNIVSEMLDSTICQQMNDARDEAVEAVFKSILREKNLDIKDKKAAIIDFIAAGIHTVGNTLVFLFHLIGSNPRVQKILHEEVATLAPQNCDIEVQDLRNAKYLRACVQEGFRVIPTTPCIARILDESIEVSGYHLNAGTVVLLHTWIAGLKEGNFKNASEFMPERWLDHSEPHSPILVAPFGAGRRICPGKRFVEQALYLILAKVIREFEITCEDELSLQFEFILAPKGPVSITFRDRQEFI